MGSLHQAIIIGLDGSRSGKRSRIDLDTSTDSGNNLLTSQDTMIDHALDFHGSHRSAHPVFYRITKMRCGPINLPSQVFRVNQCRNRARSKIFLNSA